MGAKTTIERRWNLAVKNQDVEAMRVVCGDIFDLARKGQLMDDCTLLRMALTKWKANECLRTEGPGNGCWTLGVHDDTCPLCSVYECCDFSGRLCPLAKVGDKTVTCNDPGSPWEAALAAGDKQPMVVALEQALVEAENAKKQAAKRIKAQKARIGKKVGKAL